MGVRANGAETMRAKSERKMCAPDDSLVQLSVVYPESSDRLKTLFRVFLAIPIVIALAGLHDFRGTAIGPKSGCGHRRRGTGCGTAADDPILPIVPALVV